MSIKLTQRSVNESDAQLVPKPIRVYVRGVLPKKSYENIFLHAQSPNSYNLHLYHLQIFPQREIS